MERLHNRRIMHGDMKTSNLFVITCAEEPGIKLGARHFSLRFDAFRVVSWRDPFVPHILILFDP